MREGDSLATRLKRLQVVEVSLVDRPANKRPLLMIKREGEMPQPNEPVVTVEEDMIPALQAAAKAVDGEEGKVGKLAKESQAAARLALRAAAAAKAAGVDVAALLKAEGDGPAGSCPKCGMSLTAEETAKGTCPDCGAQLKTAAANEEEDPMPMTEEQKKAAEAAKAEELQKAADAKAAHELLAKEHADTKAKLEAVTKANAELAERVAKAEGEARRRDMVAKAAKKFPHLDQTKVVGQLLKAEARGAEDLAELEDVLKQAEELAKAGTTEIGTANDGPGVSDAWSKIEALAAQLLAKSTEKMTSAEAVDKVLRTSEGKRLYDEYTAALRQ